MTHMTTFKIAARSAHKLLADERAGCVEIRRSRLTGTLVGLYRSAEAGMEADPEWPWTTVCEAHHTLVSHATRKLARENLPDPCGWCDECREIRATAATGGSASTSTRTS